MRSAQHVSPSPVLIAGVSVRALAESAVRAGARVVALDAYGDLDLRRIAQVIAIAREGDGSFDPMRVARASRAVDVGAAAYVSSFENSPAAVETLARGRTLIGNSPVVLHRAVEMIYKSAEEGKEIRF